ncbi:MAG TPA: histidine kinase [Mycobacteriales bacterium]
MRVRVLTVAGVAVSLVCVGVVAWVLSRPDFAMPWGVTGAAPRLRDVTLPIAWTATGAWLLWVRPRNAVGALVLFAGVCQAVAQAASAYGTYGIGIADPQWPAAQWVAYLGAPLWVPGLLPLVSVLLVIYPDGRLPGPRWRWPTAAATLGIAMLTVAMTNGYHDVAPGPPPATVELTGLPGAVFAGVMAVSFLGGTLVIWVMSVVRLVRSGSPERQQLAWLLFTVIPLFLINLLFVRWPAFAAALPIAIAVGVLRYHLLGMEVVLRRSLVYGLLTATVLGVYLLVTAVAGSQLNGGAAPGIVAAALVAVGLTPLRERLQRQVDRLLYGDRRDPMRAVTRFGDSVAADGEPEDLLPTVLTTVMNAVHSPGAAVRSPDGSLVAGQGSAGDGAVLPLRVSGRDVGTLHVAARRPGEPYTAGDRQLLAALAPQVAVVVRALDLAEALESERDRVVAATRAERDRLRRDLHDGLGPSLFGVSLGVQALGTALAVGDEPTATDLLGRIRAESGTAAGEIRRILDDLRPAALDDADLATAIRRHTDEIIASPPVKVDIASTLAPLTPRVETAAYRIAQEALTNVTRHAAAEHTRLALTTNDDALRMEITDDGRGFDLSRASGVGLTSMRHRAETLGGTLEVTTGETGTSVVAILPLDSRT